MKKVDSDCIGLGAVNAKDKETSKTILSKIPCCNDTLLKEWFCRYILISDFSSLDNKATLLYLSNFKPCNSTSIFYLIIFHYRKDGSAIIPLFLIILNICLI